MSCNSKGGVSRSSDPTIKDIQSSSKEDDFQTDRVMTEINTSERESLKRLRSYSDKEYFKRRKIMSPTTHERVSSPDIIPTIIPQTSQPRERYPTYPNRALTDEQCFLREEMLSAQMRRDQIARVPRSFCDEMLVSRSGMRMMKPTDLQDYEHFRRNSELKLLEQDLITHTRIPSFYVERRSSHEDISPRLYMDERRLSEKILPPSYGNRHFDHLRSIF